MRTLPVTLSGSLSLITPLLLAIELWRDYGLKWGRFFMRFIRRCPVAVSYVLVSRRSATIGELAKSKLSKTAARGLSSLRHYCWRKTLSAKVRRCISTLRCSTVEETDQFAGTHQWVEIWMRIYSVMFACGDGCLSLPGLTEARGATASFAAGVSLAPSGRYFARFIEIIVLAMLLALIALPAPARAQTITISSVSSDPGQRPARTDGRFHRHHNRQSERLELSSLIFVGAPWRPC